jgi:hypothetical protein
MASGAAQPDRYPDRDVVPEARMMWITGDESREYSRQSLQEMMLGDVNAALEQGVDLLRVSRQPRARHAQWSEALAANVASVVVADLLSSVLKHPPRNGATLVCDQHLRWPYRG